MNEEENELLHELLQHPNSKCCHSSFGSFGSIRSHTHTMKWTGFWQQSLSSILSFRHSEEKTHWIVKHGSIKCVWRNAICEHNFKYLHRRNKILRKFQYKYTCLQFSGKALRNDFCLARKRRMLAWVHCTHLLLWIYGKHQHNAWAKNWSKRFE